MKAVSLSIEVIITIVMVVLVLVVLTALFLGQTSERYTLIEHQRALSQGCSELALLYDCDATKLPNIRITNYDFSCGGSTGTLKAACCALEHEHEDVSSIRHCAYAACKCTIPPGRTDLVFPGNPVRCGNLVCEQGEELSCPKDCA